MMQRRPRRIHGSTRERSVQLRVLCRQRQRSITDFRNLVFPGLLLATCWLPNSAAAAEDFRFNRDVRPILSQSCFPCHGPDEAHREADLRLDQRAGIEAAFSGGLKQSLAWKRLLSGDPDEQMPPPDSNLEVSSEQRAILKSWIEQGAEWEGHWSFVPPDRPDVPLVEKPERIRNAIDAFVEYRLEQHGLTLSPPAEKSRLLRRVYLDLIGLPPTLEQVQAFVEDDSPDAYERVVDRLLGNKHFGERMALMWMDAARYGDSSVFHADGPRDMWAWRDWVIQSYNDNLPFDQFTIQQLAGDLLPDPTPQQLLATGFHRNNATTDEGGAIAEEFRVEYAVDRVKTTSMVWLGLSLECAQCHNHKYDPITQRDYYRFFAYFNQAADPGMQSRKGNQTPIVELFSDEQQQQEQNLQGRLSEAESDLRSRRERAEPDFQAWLKDAELQKGLAGYPLDPVLHLPLEMNPPANLATGPIKGLQPKFRGKATLTAGRFGNALNCSNDAYLDVGDVGDWEHDQPFSYGAWIKPQGKASGAVLARMKDAQAYRGYDLYCANGKIAVHIIHRWPDNAIKINTDAALKSGQWQHVFVCYDGSGDASGIRVYFDGQLQKWSIEQNGLNGSIRNDVPLYVGRRNPGSPFKGQVDEVRLYARALSEAEVGLLASTHPALALAQVPADRRQPQHATLLKDYYLNKVDADYGRLAAEIADLKKQISDLNKPLTTAMIMRDVPQPRMTYLLDRGNYASPRKDQPVEPGVPDVLPSLPPGAPANRLGLAQWLVQPQHPLTARVAVNRYWYLLFGRGIVTTLEDFGVQGAWPTHPELLDWLATDFVEHGWDIKRTLKQIVMSATYRQSSRSNARLTAWDPNNELFARGPRFRLQGELIRDQALFVSGLLNTQIGGPSVKPYQPPGLWNEVSLSGNVRFQQDHGEKLYRRSLYTYWKRSAPAPAMTIFDAPTREKCVLRRSRTNTPLQALVLLNDPQFVEAARALAERAIRSDPQVRQQIAFAYQVVTSVKPQPEVLELLLQAYRDELQVFKKEQERAESLLQVGESSRSAQIDAAAHAAMTVITSIILNLDESVTRG